MAEDNTLILVALGAGAFFLFKNQAEESKSELSENLRNLSFGFPELKAPDFSSLATPLLGLSSGFTGLSSGITGLQSSFTESIGEVSSTFSDALAGVTGSLTAIPEAIGDRISGALDNIKETATGLVPDIPSAGDIRDGISGALGSVTSSGEGFFSRNSTALVGGGGGALAGAAIGAVGGPIGIAIGAGAGLLFGTGLGIETQKNAEFFGPGIRRFFSFFTSPITAPGIGGNEFNFLGLRSSSSSVAAESNSLDQGIALLSSPVVEKVKGSSGSSVGSGSSKSPTITRTSRGSTIIRNAFNPNTRREPRTFYSSGSRF